MKEIRKSYTNKLGPKKTKYCIHHNKHPRHLQNYSLLLAELTSLKASVILRCGDMLITENANVSATKHDRS